LFITLNCIYNSLAIPIKGSKFGNINLIILFELLIKFDQLGLVFLHVIGFVIHQAKTVINDLIL